MSIKRTLLALAISACVAAPAMAQESLIDVYQRALENDPAIREAEATYLAKAEVKPQARSRAAAGLNLGARAQQSLSGPRAAASIRSAASPSATRTIFDQDSDGWSIALTQTFFDWSQYATLRQADKRVARAETDYEAAKQNLLIRVATSLLRRACGRGQPRVGRRGA